MKKALKLMAIAGGILLVSSVVVLLLFIRSLPSAWQIKQAISPRRAQNPSFVTEEKSQAQEEVSPGTTESAPTPGKSREDKIDESKTRSIEVLHADFMNEKKPLSSVCTQLAAASSSNFLRADDSGSGKEFVESLADEEKKDPLVEAAAPLLRYFFRLERVKDLIATVENAESEKDESLLEKTEFYTRIGLAAQEARAHKENFDRILMKSYNLFVMARAVGLHPELARDPATLSYCDQIEKNLNLQLDFNADEQAAELRKFLEYAKVEPKEVGYDPNYRSDVQFDFSNKSLTMNNLWIEKLFEKDIQRAEKELKEKQKFQDSEKN